MDQLKKALAWLKAQHFWVLTALVALIGVGSWFKSAGALHDEYATNEGKIIQQFNTSKSLASQEFYPNPQINQKQQEEVQRRAKAVAEMWRQLYDRQRSEVLKWPEEALTQEFVTTVENLKFGSDIPQGLRTIYQNYIANYFPKLPAIIKAPIVEGDARGAARGGRNDSRGRGEEVELTQIATPDYICEWLDQNDVRASLNFQQTPSPLQIWITQEDLWAYATLLHVVAATNEHVQADRPDNAAVRVIEELDVGRPAAEVTRTDRINLPAAVRSPSGGDATGRTSSSLTIGGGRGQETELTPDQEQQLLLSGRYVKEDGNPIDVPGGLTEFQTPFGTEYKRLPVRLVLQMDVRQLNYLIAQCANQPLQVEVKEVRINPAETGGGGGARRTAAETPIFAGRGAADAAEPFPMHPHLARVVIQGVIYIFNEPSSDIMNAANGQGGNLAQNQ